MTDRMGTFEELTGFEDLEGSMQEDIQEAEGRIFKSVAVGEMLKTNGWQIVSKFLDEEIESLRETCCIEKDAEKLKRSQMLLASLRFLPRLIDKLLYEGEVARKAFEDFEQEQTLKTPLG